MSITPMGRERMDSMDSTEQVALKILSLLEIPPQPQLRNAMLEERESRTSGEFLMINEPPLHT
jgi:hypothetical protein